MEQQSWLMRKNEWILALENRLGKKWGPFIAGVVLGALGFGFIFGLYTAPVFIRK